MENTPSRSEQTIFEDLMRLCCSPGYVHAVAYICLKDNFVGYVDTLSVEEMKKMFSWDRLIRSELTTILGLMIKSPIIFDVPDTPTFERYIEQTYALLEEFHRSLSGVFFEDIDLSGDPQEVGRQLAAQMSSGKALREPIFYAGESAFSFQFRDLAVEKYRADDDWLVAKKGFTISDAREVARAVQLLQNDKLTEVMNHAQGRHPAEINILQAFRFSEEEIRERSGKDQALISRILAAFCLKEDDKNATFRDIGDFNSISATPILRHPGGGFLLFEQYSILEALYDAPFYWMSADRGYAPKAMRNRGEFAERFSAQRLERVFGKDKVFTNVDIFESKAKKIGEIDVLVIYANRAIVLQAKSKKLTLEARKGNDGRIRDDFKKSVEESYEQAQVCADALNSSTFRFVNSTGAKVPVPRFLSEIYVFCVVSDHYPALSFQVEQFLKPKPSGNVKYPFIMDVFTLDAMTEMLDSPLHFLSYVDKRISYGNRLHAGHELTLLSFHLKRNLWIEGQYDKMMVGDEFSAELDVSMTVRRDNLPGPRTPDGILTRTAETALGKVVADIEHSGNSRIVDLGMVLLTLSENAFKGISKGMEAIGHRARRDGANHDCTVLLDECGTGLTIHCNLDSVSVAARSLRRHCELRKYMSKSRKWFGICISPLTLRLRFGVTLDYSWAPSTKMDALTKGMNRKPTPLRELMSQPKKKVGRNDPCPCGSGLKFKKCCLT